MDLMYLWLVLYKDLNISFSELIRLWILFYFLTNLCAYYYFKNDEDSDIKYHLLIMNNYIPFIAFLMIIFWYIIDKSLDSIYFIKRTNTYNWIKYQLNKER